MGFSWESLGSSEDLPGDLPEDFKKENKDGSEAGVLTPRAGVDAASDLAPVSSHNESDEEDKDGREAGVLTSRATPASCTSQPVS